MLGIKLLQLVLMGTLGLLVVTLGILVLLEMIREIIMKMVQLVLLGIMLQPLLVLLRLLEMLLGMTLELVLMGMPGSGLPHSICITVFQLFASRNYIYKVNPSMYHFFSGLFSKVFGSIISRRYK